jgi:hypothetical protein
MPQTTNVKEGDRSRKASGQHQNSGIEGTRRYRGYLRDGEPKGRNRQIPLRRGAQSQKPQEVRAPSKIPKHVMKQIENIVELAESSSTRLYIPQGPGGITKFAFQSPAERHYQRALAKAAQYGDASLVKGITIKVAERFDSINKVDVAFEWARLSKDEDTVRKIGARAALHHQGRAEAFAQDFFGNGRSMDHYRKAITFAVKSKNPHLVKQIGIDAINRYDSYGDKLVGKQSFIGLQVGHARAIKWARALGESELADKIHNKVVGRYSEDSAINPLTRAFAGLMGDEEQVEIIREILDNRRKVGGGRKPALAV